MGEYAEYSLARQYPEVFGNGRPRRKNVRPRAGHYQTGTVSRKATHVSDINPKNYDGASVVIVGNAGGPMEIKSFEGSNNSQAQLSVAVGKGYKKNDQWVDTGTDWYTLIASVDYAQQNWPDIESGDKVRIDGARLEFRPYKKKDGEAGVEAQLRFGTLTVVSSKSSRSSGTAAGYVDDTPF